MQKAIVLAAGKGTRLQTEGITVPKVMREADGKPLLHYVLKNLDFIDRENIVLVVGYRREDVLAAFGDYPYAVQEPQRWQRRLSGTTMDRCWSAMGICRCCGAALMRI